jgi:hypothetical protein
MSFSSRRVVARCWPARPGCAFWRTARIPGTEWAAFICTVAPDLYIGYFRELSALIAQRGSLDQVEENAILEVMARYSTEPYLPSGS